MAGAVAAAAGDGDALMRDATSFPALASLSGSPFPTQTELLTPFPFPATLGSDPSTPTTTQLYEDPGRPVKAGGAAKVAAAPLSRVAQLNARIEKDPLDGEARLALLADAEQKGDLERTREVYEDFLRVFPDAVSDYLSSPRAVLERWSPTDESYLRLNNGSRTSTSSSRTRSSRASRPFSLAAFARRPRSTCGSSTSTTSVA